MMYKVKMTITYRNNTVSELIRKFKSKKMIYPFIMNRVLSDDNILSLGYTDEDIEYV